MQRKTLNLLIIKKLAVNPFLRSDLDEANEHHVML